MKNKLFTNRVESLRLYSKISIT